MNRAVPDCLGHWVEELRLPDADDRHVLAAAIRGGAPAIVTLDLKNFGIGDVELQPRSTASGRLRARLDRLGARFRVHTAF
jgi:hypothetical protein